MTQNLSKQEQTVWRELILSELGVLQLENKAIRHEDKTDVVILKEAHPINVESVQRELNVSNFYAKEDNGKVNWAMTGTLTLKGSPSDEGCLQSPAPLTYYEQRDNVASSRDKRDRSVRNVSLNEFPSDEDRSPASVKHHQQNHNGAQGGGDEVLMSHADTMKYLLTQGEEEGALMSHSDTLQYLLCDSFNHHQIHDESSQGQRDNAQGEEREILMSHTDSIKYILQDCGIGETFPNDVEEKETTQKKEAKLIKEDNDILKRLKKKSELIEKDIEMAIRVMPSAGTNNSASKAVNTLLNELKIKNELIKQDINMIEGAEAVGNSSFFKLRSPFGTLSLAVCSSAGPTELVQSRQASTAPTLSWIYNEAGINCGNHQKDGEEEVLMSHSETLKYLLEDCGIGKMND